MITLCIDTAYKYLTCVLIKDDEIIAKYSKECFKRQSEEVFVALDEIFNAASINKKDIDAICISEGPGSYTGVRIAMSIAKTISELFKIDLYTISTLRLYASNKENTMVLMDARASRAYVGIYNKDEILLEDCALPLVDIDPKDYNVIGDGELIGKDNVEIDIPDAFLKTKYLWKKVDKIAYLVPKYLKESDSYYR
ncbi:MAG: tRNA (adenosine(37)-N6)-threonylcarbamoyltransferase complex dimerization subunit type 1 TsaB [Erysipelotrichaceae bacterium]|nr:tRNA (adenosine(37)-N6)-threonylcarbamoyltransferase complex dimerization subunit type 1 TsaB [Erysipelotrichaceae bacterium]